MKELFYSNCPVANAFLPAIKLFPDWFARREVQFSLLPSGNAVTHFAFRHPAYFRLGGEIPPLLSEGLRDPGLTRLIGLTPCRGPEGIFVRPDSDIQKAAQLAGRRIAMTRNAIAVLHNLAGANYLALDPWAQTQMALGSWEARGLINTLATAGLSIDEVEIHEVPNPWAAHDLKSAESSASFAPKDLFFDPASPVGNQQVAALAEGRVDAIFSFLPYGAEMELKGYGRLLLDLSKLPGNEYTSTWTVSSALVESHPEAVQSVVETVVEMGLWAASHPREIARAHAENLGVSEAAVWKGFGADFHARLVPSLSAEDLAGLDNTQRFLVAHGLIPKPIDLSKWVYDRFLRDAQGAEPAPADSR
ncbi:MAG: ABC transporter substrate-binding protein [Candidatus Binataceae bacterium]|nr:ABC transporter substrate-binding protein [Candidatus Binataceae bacterium]